MPLNRGQIFQMAVGPRDKDTITRITGMVISLTISPLGYLVTNTLPLLQKGDIVKEIFGSTKCFLHGQGYYKVLDEKEIFFLLLISFISINIFNCSIFLFFF